MSKKVGVIICAAGASERFGGSTKSTTGKERKKPFVDIAGRAVLIRSIEVFADRDDVKQILLAIAPEDEELVNVKWGPNLKFYNVTTCFGGAERFETVQKCLELIKDNIDLIAVHDAVRCCITKKWVDEVIAEAAKSGAAILACPVAATLKKAEDNCVIQTVDRASLYEAQTPQVFEAELLKKAYENLKNPDNKITGPPRDDSQLVEALGQKVSIVETDSSNIKITHKTDLAIAEAILKSRSKPVPKGPTGPYVEAQW